MTDDSAPATRADVAEVRTEVGGLRTEVGGLRAEVGEVRTELYRVTDQLRDRIENLETRLEEAIHDSQTELLKAFYGFTESVRHRFDGLEDSDVNLKKRMTTLESRILEIEKRLNMPPAA